MLIKIGKNQRKINCNGWGLYRFMTHHSHMDKFVTWEGVAVITAGAKDDALLKVKAY